MLTTQLGIQITVFGTIAPNGTGVAPQSSYSIDGGPETVFPGNQLPIVQYKQTFFDSGILSAPGQHTLIIENLTPNGRLFLDFVNISTSTSTTLVSPSAGPASSVLPLGAIIGGLIGGTCVIGLVITVIILWKRKQETRSSQRRIDRFIVTRESTGLHINS